MKRDTRTIENISYKKRNTTLENTKINSIKRGKKKDTRLLFVVYQWGSRIEEVY